jgi:hypothetical protein
MKTLQNPAALAVLFAAALAAGGAHAEGYGSVKKHMAQDAKEAAGQVADAAKRQYDKVPWFDKICKYVGHVSYAKDAHSPAKLTEVRHYLYHTARNYGIRCPNKIKVKFAKDALGPHSGVVVGEAAWEASIKRNPAHETMEEIGTILKLGHCTYKEDTGFIMCLHGRNLIFKHEVKDVNNVDDKPAATQVAEEESAAEGVEDSKAEQKELAQLQETLKHLESREP